MRGCWTSTSLIRARYFCFYSKIEHCASLHQWHQTNNTDNARLKTSSRYSCSQDLFRFEIKITFQIIKLNYFLLQYQFDIKLSGRFMGNALSINCFLQMTVRLFEIQMCLDLGNCDNNKKKSTEVWDMSLDRICT